MSAMAPSRAVDQLRTIVAADHAHELTAIARELAAVQSSGGTSALSGVAVLCRLRTQVSEVRRVLKDFGVPTRSHHQAGSSQAQDAFDVLAYFALCTRPGDDDAFDKAIAIPSRPGFAQGQAAHRYLQAAARTHRCSLLRAAQLAQQHSFPAVVHGGASCKLTKPQQSALTDFLGVVISLRNAAIGPQNGALGPLLKRLIHRVGLVDHLAKQKQSRQSRRRAFVVRVPGQPAEDSSSEGESDGEADTADAQVTQAHEPALAHPLPPRKSTHCRSHARRSTDSARSRGCSSSPLESKAASAARTRRASPPSATPSPSPATTQPLTTARQAATAPSSPRRSTRRRDLSGRPSTCQSSWKGACRCFLEVSSPTRSSSSSTLKRNAASCACALHPLLRAPATH